MKQFGRQLPKTVDELIQLARDQDWVVGKTTQGHARLVAPGGQIVIYSGTTSDTNSVWDFRARLKRFGLKPAKGKKPKLTLPEPKLVVDKSKPVEAEVRTVTEPEKTVRKPASQENRGKGKQALTEVMRQHDTVQGLGSLEVLPLINEKLTLKMTQATVSSMLTYYNKNGLLEKISYGRYRLKELMGSSTAAPVPAAHIVVPATPQLATEDDDEKILIEFLVMLDKVGNIVKKHMELATVLKKLGGNK